MSFFLVKHFHMTVAALSFGGFVVRGWWMLRGSPMLQRTWVRITPHIVDTLLLVSGVYMAWVLRASPTEQPWLAAKLIALVAYIVVGSVALKRGRTRTIRAVALAAAVAIFVYIVAVAISHNPLPTGFGP